MARAKERTNERNKQKTKERKTTNKKDETNEKKKKKERPKEEEVQQREKQGRDAWLISCVGMSSHETRKMMQKTADAIRRWWGDDVT